MLDFSLLPKAIENENAPFPTGELAKNSDYISMYISESMVGISFKFKSHKQQGFGRSLLNLLINSVPV